MNETVAMTHGPQVLQPMAYITWGISSQIENSEYRNFRTAEIL